MRDLASRLPGYYRESGPVSELERALGQAAAELMDAKEDTLEQLFVETATWGLALWENWAGLPTDLSRPYSWRRQRILAKLRGQGTTTAELIAQVVASFGYSRENVCVVEHPGEYTFEVVLSNLGQAPQDVAAATAAINEIKPAHLDWHFTYQLAQLLAQVRVGGGFWGVRETVLPPAE